MKILAMIMEFAPDPNPITDFDYEIGTGVADGYVILKEYIGSSSTVIIPNTYKISDVTYNTAIYIGFGNGSPQSRPTTFKNNTTIVNVTLPSQYMVYYEGTSSSDFSLTNTSMLMLFYRCTNLLSIQNMPSSVTDMYSTFSGCTSLVTAPTIGSSVTNMAGAFSGCTSLVNAPAIPNSVTTIYQIFYGCTSLVNAPTIPSSVTTMYEAFSGCSSLEGTIRINSSNVTIPNAQNFHPFYDTVNNLTVQVPENSTTYTNLNNNKPANVTITTFTP